MAHEQHRIRPTHGTQERIDRLVASTMHRFFTILISASSLAVIVCCLGALR